MRDERDLTDLIPAVLSDYSALKQHDKTTDIDLLKQKLMENKKFPIMNKTKKTKYKPKKFITGKKVITKYKKGHNKKYHHLKQLSKLKYYNKKNQYKCHPNAYDNPSGDWLRLPGPPCNWNKCNKQIGCGDCCVCLDYGWYGHRCMPRCCQQMDNITCKQQFPNVKQVQCILPPHAYPIEANDAYFMPYHKYQGGQWSYPKYGGFQ